MRTLPAEEREGGTEGNFRRYYLSRDLTERHESTPKLCDGAEVEFSELSDCLACMWGGGGWEGGGEREGEQEKY